MAKCEAMFERVPDTFPPKKVMSGMDEIRGRTERILELLETRGDPTSEREVAAARAPMAVTAN